MVSVDSILRLQNQTTQFLEMNEKPKRVRFLSKPNLCVLSKISRLNLTNLQRQKLNLSEHIITTKTHTHTHEGGYHSIALSQRPWLFNQIEKVLTMREPLLSMWDWKSEGKIKFYHFQIRDRQSKDLVENECKIGFKREKKKKISLGFHQTLNQFFVCDWLYKCLTKTSLSHSPKKFRSMSDRLRIWSEWKWDPKGQIRRGVWWVRLSGLHTIYTTVKCRKSTVLCWRHIWIFGLLSLNS